MKTKDKTIEELLDIQQDLHLSREAEQDGLLARLINIKEELYRKISKDKDSEYAPSLLQIKQSLLSDLIRYGTYLKTEYQKDDYAAKINLRKALKYDPKNPIAHYRLGFLAYKKERYIDANTYFYKALQYQEIAEDKHYLLHSQQMYYANLYLCNSALYIAHHAQESLKTLSSSVEEERIPNLEISPLFEMITQNDRYIHEHAFTMTTKDGSKSCPKESCEEAIDRYTNTIILYFSDRKNLVLWNGEGEQLNLKQAEMLQHFLLYSNELAPTKWSVFLPLFDTEVRHNTVIQNVSRLRRKLASLGISSEVITNTTYHGQTAYFFNESIPYIVMHRSDESFILQR